MSVQKVIEPLIQIESFWKNQNIDNLNGMLPDFELLMKYIRFPFSKTELGKYILSYQNQSDITAAFMLYLHCFPIRSSSSNEEQIPKAIIDPFRNFIGIPNNNQTVMNYLRKFEPEKLEANRLLMGFEFKANKSALAKLLNYFEEAIVSIEEHVLHAHDEADTFANWMTKKKTDYTESMEESIEKLFERYKTVRAREAKLNAQIKSDSKEAFDEAINITETAKDTYQSQIELDESVKYWNTKETTHKTSRDAWFKNLTGCIIITIILPLLLFLFNFSFGLPDEKLLLGTINPITIAFSILIISLGSFCLRFCSRQYDSQQHLFLESIERQTMLKTFLALMNENKLKEFEDRKIALDTLFRPAQTGVVEDYGNIVPSDSVLKIIEKQANKS